MKNFQIPVFRLYTFFYIFRFRCKGSEKNRFFVNIYNIAKIQKHLAACPQCARQYKAMLEVSRLPLEALAEEAAAQPEEQTR